MAEDTLAARSLPPLPIEVWQLVMDTVWDATTYSTFYANQDDYRSWALVSRAWRTCAHAVLFRTVELPDPVHLRRFATLLDAAPHLAVYVRTLRAYSRDLHTRENVLALLPSVLSGDVLPNLRSLLVTRVTEQDTWHPHAARPPTDKELAYMPLPLDPPSDTSDGGADRCGDRGGGWGFRQGLEAHFAGVSELYLSYVTFETFGALAQTLHALGNLRLLSCLEVRWRALGAMPACLAWKGEGEGRGQGQGQGQGVFLPKLEDLTIAYMDLHGVERLLAALGGHSAAQPALKGLYIDCPHYCPVALWDPPSADPATGTPLGIDLRAFSRLGSLWLALPYTLSACRELPEIVATLLRTWNPTIQRERASAPRKLTLTPSYESDFTRVEFTELLRALGPVIEDVLGEPPLKREDECEEKADLSGGERGCAAEVEVCVVDKADMREWWREEAQASFARLGARGRLDVTFEKGFWPEAQWLDDSYEQEAEEALSAAQHVGGSGIPHGERIVAAGSGNGAYGGGGYASDGVARRRRRSLRFTSLRKPKWKNAFHALRQSLSKLKLSRLSWRKRTNKADPEVLLGGT